MDEFNKNYDNFFFLGDSFFHGFHEQQYVVASSYSLNDLQSQANMLNILMRWHALIWITNWPNLFQHNSVLETNLSDFHMILP